MFDGEKKNELLRAMGFTDKVIGLAEKYEAELKPRFDELDKTAEFNQLKVIKAMQDKTSGVKSLHKFHAEIE